MNPAKNSRKTAILVNMQMDHYACGYYRMAFPDMALRSNKKLNYASMKFDGPTTALTNIANDKCIYKAQRFHSEKHAKYFTAYLEQLKLKSDIKIIYDIDDILIAEDMPHYNPSTKEHKDTRQHLKTMMDIATNVSVSTVELGMYYSSVLGIPLSKFRVVPNFMPKWWSYTSKEPKKIPKDRRIRIGFPCSYSHFNHNPDNTSMDDFSHLTDLITRTCDVYEWVFFAHVPKKLWHLMEQGKITVVNGSDFLNYLGTVKSKNLDLIVAPLEDSKFNKCKSNIKLLEAAACRIPFVGQNISTYNKYTNSVFTSGTDLQNQINRIFASNKSLNDEINKNDAFMDSDKCEDRNNGWWLENNLHYHTDVYERLI
jgi:hypothetical protein